MSLAASQIRPLMRGVQRGYSELEGAGQVGSGIQVPGKSAGAGRSRQVLGVQDREVRECSQHQ